MLHREDLRLIARVFDYKKIDLLLVLNIVTHNFDYIKDFPDNFTCEYRHPKSQFKEKDENKRNPSKDVKKKARKNTNLETNDDLYGNNELEYEEETLSTFKLNINCEKASDPINLNLTKIVDKQKKQQGGKKKKDYSDLKNAPLTSKEDKGNSDEAISKKEDNNEEENQTLFPFLAKSTSSFEINFLFKLSIVSEFFFIIKNDFCSLFNLRCNSIIYMSLTFLYCNLAI